MDPNEQYNKKSIKEKIIKRNQEEYVRNFFNKKVGIKRNDKRR